MHVYVYIGTAAIYVLAFYKLAIYIIFMQSHPLSFVLVLFCPKFVRILQVTPNLPSQRTKLYIMLFQLPCT